MIPYRFHRSRPLDKIETIPVKADALGPPKTPTVWTVGAYQDFVVKGENF